MIGYVTVGTNDLPRAVAFYDALLAELGGKRVMEFDRGYAWTNGKTGAPGFGVMTPFNGEAACIGNGTMVALYAPSPEVVDRVHAKALELGGTDEGPVGERFPGFYAGYFRDLDGNKLNIFHMAAPAAD